VFRRILVGYDGSDYSAHALRVALNLAERLGAEVVALSAINTSPMLEVAEDRSRSRSNGVRTGRAERLFASERRRSWED
jgi:nucleotide-binding universal stress UspA family protein